MSLSPILNYINETVHLVPKLPLPTVELSKPLLDAPMQFLYETVLYIIRFLVYAGCFSDRVGGNVVLAFQCFSYIINVCKSDLMISTVHVLDGY